MGLINGVNCYDTSMKTPFGTYVYSHIKNEMTKYLEAIQKQVDHCMLISTPFLTFIVLILNMII